MRNFEIIAHKITNLTDARYFAARGVNWLGFLVTKPIEMVQIDQILQWVEGPKVLVESENVSQIDTHLFDNITGLWTPHREYSIDKVYFSSDTNEDPDYLIVEPNNIPLQKYFERTFLNIEIPNINLLERALNYKMKGILISGTPEEKIGFKSYDLYDELFDYLENLDLPQD